VWHRAAGVRLKRISPGRPDLTVCVCVCVALSLTQTDRQLTQATYNTTDRQTDRQTSKLDHSTLKPVDIRVVTDVLNVLYVGFGKNARILTYSIYGMGMNVLRVADNVYEGLSSSTTVNHSCYYDLVACSVCQLGSHDFSTDIHSVAVEELTPD